MNDGQDARSATGLPVAGQVAVSRVQLAAALLDYDVPDHESGQVLPAQRSAMLSPFRHLLPTHSATSVGQSDQNQHDTSGAASYPITPADTTAEATQPERFENRWRGYDVGAQPPLGPNGQMNAEDSEEAERLASEWGLGGYLSQLGSGSQSGSVGSIGSPLSGILGLPLTATNSHGISTDNDPDATEALETHSMPDLDHARPLSAFSMYNSAQSVSGPTELPVRRVKILERRTSDGQLKPQSLEALNLPSFGDLASLAAGNSTTSASSPTDTRPGSVQRVSVFSLADRTTATSFPSRISSDMGRPSTSMSRPMSSYSRPLSRLSIATSGVVRATTPGSTTGFPSRQSTQEEDGNDDDEPLETLVSKPHSTSPTTPFTSRFDPAMLALARQEIEKERPVFKNKSASAPPAVVLMPAPLAGRSLSPPRKPRVDGPDDDQDSEQDPDLDGPGDEDDEATLQRPAGALYGRSLMDVMTEKKALLKARARHYDAGKDGRRSMGDWADSPAAQRFLATTGTVDDGASIVGTGALAKPQAPHLPGSRSVMSMFGPDVIYQRDLEQLRLIEADEERERLAREELEAAEKEQERELAEQRHSGKGKLLKAKRRSQLGLEAEQQRELESNNLAIQAAEARAAAPVPSLPSHLVDLDQDLSLDSWFPAPPPGHASMSGTSDTSESLPQPQIPPPTRLPLSTTSMHDTRSRFEDKRSGEHTSALRSAVMMGTMSPSDAAAEYSRLGLGQRQRTAQDVSYDDRPLGERLTSGPSSSTSPPPRLRLDLALESRRMPLSRREQSHLAVLQSVEGDSPPQSAQVYELHDEDLKESWNGSIRPVRLEARDSGVGPEPTGLRHNNEDEDDDDVPLALRGRTLNGDEDDEDVPLAVRRASMLLPIQPGRYDDEDDEDDDDRPLGLKVSSGGGGQGAAELQNYQRQQLFMLQQQQQQQHHQLQQQQMAFQLAMQQSQQYGYAGSEMSGSTGAAVDRWRRGVEG